MSFLDLAKTPEKQPASGPGKGKKQCPECKEYVGARSKICPNCNYDFELKTPSLFSNLSQKSIIEKLNITPDTLVQWVLMCSYLYYVKGDSIIDDKEFDSLIEMMKNKWDILNHRHLHLISEETVKTNSLFNLKEDDYPQIIRHSALRLLKAKKKFKTTIDDVVQRKLFNQVSFNEMVY